MGRIQSVVVMGLFIGSCAHEPQTTEDRSTQLMFKQDESFPKVTADIAEYDAHVAQSNSAFAKIPENIKDKAWVKIKLTHMVEVDQYMRTYSGVIYDHNYSTQESQYFWDAFFPRWSALDRENTESLKLLLKTYSWFTITEFGGEADKNAWLLVQHADLDKPFQKSILSILKDLYPKGETNRSNYAYLEDRVTVGEGRPQIYGTQGACTGPGTWGPNTILDPENVDKRRADMGLEPMAVYKTRFKDICKKRE